MKVVVSHDVDHLTFAEHWRDAAVPKFLLRGVVEAARGGSSGRALVRKLQRLAANRAHNLEALLAFNREQGVPGTFFFATGRGRDLAYGPRRARPWIERVLEQGLEVGLHAIAFDRPERIRWERQRLEEITGSPVLGVRLHNVGMADNAGRLTDAFAPLFAQAGFSYCSNTYGVCDPYRVGGLWELPILITDGYTFRNNSRVVNRTLQQAQEFTLARLERAEAAGLHYVSVLFHDVYFDPAFAPLDQWYRWLIQELHRRGWEFCSCRDVVTRLGAGAVVSASAVVGGGQR